MARLSKTAVVSWRRIFRRRSLSPGIGRLLIQLFANLVENTLRHTPSHTRVVMRLRRTGAYALAEISDNGPGIPREEQSRVFRRFYRLERSRTTPGNGLGLSLVAAIVELHDATIEVTDNTPGVKITIGFSANDD
uniref:sensor histidine kinase n=1 Tax=Bradyrhizobium guangxiense TaxID=1325115 RepID=UPI003703EFB7